MALVGLAWVRGAGGRDREASGDTAPAPSTTLPMRPSPGRRVPVAPQQGRQAVWSVRPQPCSRPRPVGGQAGLSLQAWASTPIPRPGVWRRRSGHWVLPPAPLKLLPQSPRVPSGRVLSSEQVPGASAPPSRPSAGAWQLRAVPHPHRRLNRCVGRSRGGRGGLCRPSPGAPSPRCPRDSREKSGLEVRGAGQTWAEDS